PGGGRCEAKRVEAHDHRRVRRNCTSFTRGVPGVGERASAGRERVVDPVAELDEERAVAKRAYARIAQDRNGATFTLALANASRTACAISGAPGVSPCTQRVSTTSSRKLPSTANT